jgi:transcriptional regulator of heat shock response
METMINQRQSQILNKIVEEYIDSAKPVSSQLLGEKTKLEICPATIRSEMQRLTDKGYLKQPHTSAGRIPTDRGYEFFVGSLLEKNFFEEDFDSEECFESEMKDNFQLMQVLTKNLASISSSLVFSYLCRENFLWKDGWENIFQEPEFEEKKYLSSFAKFIREFENSIAGLEIAAGMKVYIGKNPFSRSRDFSVIISGCAFPKKQKGALAFLGPKRMSYPKNIGLLKSTVKLLENL